MRGIPALDLQFSLHCWLVVVSDDQSSISPWYIYTSSCGSVSLPLIHKTVTIVPLREEVPDNVFDIFWVECYHAKEQLR